MLFCVLPTDPRATALAIACVAYCCMHCAVFHSVTLGLFDANRACAPPRHTAYGCAAFRAINVYAIVVLTAFTFLVLWLGVALYGSLSRSRWLPARPPRATLDALWRLVGAAMIAYAAVWIAEGFLELTDPVYDLNLFSASEDDYTAAGRAAIRFALGSFMIVLGVVALWPGTRVFVQSRLIEASLFPYAILLQVTPVVAIAPLIIIWVKEPTLALVICATLVAIFPIISNTVLGLRSVNPGLLNLFRILFQRVQLYFKRSHASCGLRQLHLRHFTPLPLICSMLSLMCQVFFKPLGPLKVDRNLLFQADDTLLGNAKLLVHRRL
jgi:ABC-type nitrate/sulfonate/bicarbonate transport system permease component